MTNVHNALGGTDHIVPSLLIAVVPEGETNSSTTELYFRGIMYAYEEEREEDSSAGY